MRTLLLKHRIECHWKRYTVLIFRSIEANDTPKYDNQRARCKHTRTPTKILRYETKRFVLDGAFDSFTILWFNLFNFYDLRLFGKVTQFALGGLNSTEVSRDEINGKVKTCVNECCGEIGTFSRAIRKRMENRKMCKESLY